MSGTTDLVDINRCNLLHLEGLSATKKSAVACNCKTHKYLHFAQVYSLSQSQLSVSKSAVTEKRGGLCNEQSHTATPLIHLTITKKHEEALCH